MPSGTVDALDRTQPVNVFSQPLHFSYPFFVCCNHLATKIVGLKLYGILSFALFVGFPDQILSGYPPHLNTIRTDVAKQ